MKSILPSHTIGIIGGGQLGKMLTEAGNRMGYRILVLDPSPEAPAFCAAHETIIANFDDPQAFETLAAKCDVVTYEFENINAALVADINKKYNNIPQGSSALYTTQNREREKAALIALKLPVVPYMILENVAQDIGQAISEFSLPLVIKTLEGGYDGKGQIVLKETADLAKLTPLLSHRAIAEKFIDYDFEVSVIGTRSTDGELTTFPITKNHHINNILHTSLAKDNILSKAQELELVAMLKIFMETHNIVGTFAMEAFVVADCFYVNELAPRPHNSGHYTIEGCETSQFEQHIRAICGLPLGTTNLRGPTIMYNILGQHKPALLTYLAKLSPHGHLHLYGKNADLHNRKIGHITFTDLAAGEAFSQSVFGIS